MSNPDIGRYEIQSLIDMDGDEMAEYIEAATVLNLRSKSPLPPHILRAMLTLLRYVGEDEEADLQAIKDKGLVPDPSHIGYATRVLAHWLSVSSLPVGAWKSWKEHGIKHRVNPITGDLEPMV